MPFPTDSKQKIIESIQRNVAMGNDLNQRYEAETNPYQKALLKKRLEHFNAYRQTFVNTMFKSFPEAVQNALAKQYELNVPDAKRFRLPANVSFQDFMTNALDLHEKSLYWTQVNDACAAWETEARASLRSTTPELDDWVVNYPINSMHAKMLVNVHTYELIMARKTKLYMDIFEDCRTLLTHDPHASERLTLANQLTSISQAERKQELSRHILLHPELNKFINIRGTTRLSVNFATHLNDPKDFPDLLNSRTFTLSDTLKQQYLTIFEMMDDANFAPDVDDVSAEQPIKKYAFSNLLNTGEKIAQIFDKATSDEPDFSEYETLPALAAQYRDAEEKLDALFTVVEDIFGDELGSFPENVDTTRNPSVPVKYKKNLKANIALNSMYLAYCFVKRHNLDFEEYLENPYAVTKNVLDRLWAERDFIANTAGLSLGSVLGKMVVSEPDARFNDDLLLASRAMEGMLAFEENRQLAAENHVSFLTVYNYGLAIDKELGRFSSYPQHSFAIAAPAMFIMPADELDLLKVSQDKLLDPKTLTYSQGSFNLVDYIEKHEIDFTVLQERIIETFGDYFETLAATPTTNSAQELKRRQAYVDLVNGAREAVAYALLLKQPDKASVQDLMEFMAAPNEFLQKNVDTQKLPLPEVGAPTALKSIADTTILKKKELETKQKAFEKQSQAFNKQATALQKQIDKLFAKKPKPEDVAKAVNQIEALKNELQQLKTQEFARIAQAVTDKTVTQAYATQRQEDITSNQQNKPLSLFGDFRDKSTFLKEQALAGHSKETALRLYQEKVTELQAAKRALEAEYVRDIVVDNYVQRQAQALDALQKSQPAFLADVAPLPYQPQTDTPSLGKTAAPTVETTVLETTVEPVQPIRQQTTLSAELRLSGVEDVAPPTPQAQPTEMQREKSQKTIEDLETEL